MGLTAVQINYTLMVEREEFESASEDVLAAIADTPGLKWMVWLHDPDHSRGGGHYVFDSRTAAQRFLDSPLIDRLEHSPCVSEVTIHTFDILADHSRATHAPID